MDVVDELFISSRVLTASAKASYDHSYAHTMSCSLTVSNLRDSSCTTVLVQLVFNTW